MLHSFARCFSFCYYLFSAVVWVIVMLKFWLLGLLIGALSCTFCYCLFHAVVWIIVLIVVVLNWNFVLTVWRTTLRFELLLYSFTSFQPKENQKVWNREGKESDTIWNRENLPAFLLYSFTVMAAYLSSFLFVFLSSLYINTNRTRMIWLMYL